MSILEQINEKLRRAPPSVVEEVLDFVNFLEAKKRIPAEPQGDLGDHFGALKDFKGFEGDLVEIQRKLRDEWER